MLREKDCFKLKPNFVWREEEDGGFLFDANTGKLRITNITAMQVMQHCDGEHDLKAIIDSVSRSFEDVPYDTIEKDIRRFLEQIVHDERVVIIGECLDG